jgi:DNA-binding NarL/FixJ family response regulator
MVRILIADDHDVLRRGLRDLLREHDRWEVCGEASNGRDAVELACRMKPDIAILDLSMPVMNGLEAARRIKQELPDSEILIFTLHESEDLVAEVLRAGARGYLLKSDLECHIATAVEALSKHRPFFTWKVSETMLNAFVDTKKAGGTITGPSCQLTAREREIVQLLAEGRSNKAVSASLGITVKTVETHRAAIMRKLRISSIAELVRYAVRNNMIQP